MEKFKSPDHLAQSGDPVFAVISGKYKNDHG